MNRTPILVTLLFAAILTPALAQTPKPKGVLIDDALAKNTALLSFASAQLHK